MSAAVGCPTMSLAARYMALYLVALLAGCTTTSSAWSQERLLFEAPRVAAPRQGVLLAMSDGPAASGESAGPTVQGYSVPGRKPGSQMPWEFFMGSASHRLIAYMYGVNHPRSRTYYNTKPLKTIIRDTGLGDVSRLLPNEDLISPDITDVSLLVLFEIKPWNERALQEGREEARRYITALNRTILDGAYFKGGTNFHGELLIRFARGQYIWRLEWKTSEPGVVQYQWTRSQKPFDSEAAAYKAAQWVDLEAEELRQYGGWKRPWKT